MKKVKKVTTEVVVEPVKKRKGNNCYIWKSKSPHTDKLYLSNRRCCSSRSQEDQGPKATALRYSHNEARKEVG